MGAAGLARVQKTFSAEHMVRNTLRVYERVVRRNAQLPTSNSQRQARGRVKARND